MGELANELAVSEERNRQLKNMLDEKVRSQQEILAQEENSQRLRAELESDELRYQLRAMSIELGWKQSLEGKSYDYRDNRDKKDLRRSQLFEENFLIVKVPSGLVGRIIGHGGYKINELQDQSGAKIKVSKLEKLT